jgi:hypothetical protein
VDSVDLPFSLVPVTNFVTVRGPAAAKLFVFSKGLTGPAIAVGDTSIHLGVWAVERLGFEIG